MTDGKNDQNGIVYLVSNEHNDSKAEENRNLTASMPASLIDIIHESENIVRRNIDKHMAKTVYPWIESIKSTKLSNNQRVLIEIIELELSKLVESESANKLNTHLSNMTKRERQVADLIMKRKRSTEIAEILNISVRTVESIRNRIRKKLGIQSKSSDLHKCLIENTNQ
jgi:RNA polymerase sigma factor (sigma-70 family)